MSGAPSRGGAPDARTRRIEDNLGLARHLAWVFAHRGEAIEDLQQVAYIGLIHAADRYDESLGYEFSTFATHTIVGELKRHLRDRVWAVKMPRTLQERYLRVSAIVEDLTHELGRSPAVHEVAVAGRIRDDEVVSALEAARGYRASSLDALPTERAPGPSLDTVADDAVAALERDEIVVLLGALRPRERELVRLRFVDELSQDEIAERLGISQMHVSRLLRRAIEELRQAYGEAR